MTEILKVVWTVRQLASSGEKHFKAGDGRTRFGENRFIF